MSESKLKKRETPEPIIGATVYFPEAGPKNMAAALEIAARRAEELGIRSICVATTSGRTGVAAARRFKGRRVVVVSHSAGFARPGHQELSASNRRLIEAEGACLLTCQHAFGGVGRAVRKKLGTYELEEIVAYTLRLFGEGTKVALEIALMAADAGLIPTDEPCLSIGGTGSGADTVLLLRPANAQTFFDLRVMEVIAKPRFG
jgi:hypothetical protein